MKKVFLFFAFSVLWLVPIAATAQTTPFSLCNWQIKPEGQTAEVFCDYQGDEYKADGCSYAGVLAPDPNRVCCCFKAATKPAANNNCYWQIEDFPSHISRKTTYYITCQNNMEKVADTKCANVAKHIPAGSQANYGCCCYKDVITGTAPKTPTFDPIKFQVPISTIKLSKVECQADDSGNYHCSIPWLGEYITGIYNYGLSVVGILAAIALMAGGLLWLTSAGDSGKITQAKDIITGGVTGLAILLASYIILLQVNPALVKFNPLSIGSVKVVDIEPASNEGNANNSTECSNCVTLDSRIKSLHGRKINSDLNNKLVIALGKSAGLEWRVNEAYPPSSTHKSTCHYNGMCVDVGLIGDKSCANVEKLIQIMKESGLTILNEYTSCGGAQTTYSTGGHLHVR